MPSARVLEHRPVTSPPANQKKVTTLQPSSNILPLKTLPWKPSRIPLNRNHTFSLLGPVVNHLLLQTLTFWFVWPHCASGTWTCVQWHKEHGLQALCRRWQTWLKSGKVKGSKRSHGRRDGKKLWWSSRPTSETRHCQLKKNTHCESCELRLIWGKVRTIAQETAPQIALRNCSKEEEVKVSTYLIWWKGNACNQAHIFCRSFLLVSRSSHHHEGF